LAKYRAALIQNTFLKLCGTQVQGGPFAGMEFVERSAEGCLLPKLLGCYEAELHGFFSELPALGYETVLNIGCAEGYYAVGIKRLLPSARVVAFDLNADARESCRAVAAKNGVEIEIAELFRIEDFARFPGKVLVWCDIEGDEAELLDPMAAPALRQMNIVVELHARTGSHSRDIVLPRFAESHDIELLVGEPHSPALPPFLRELAQLDQLLAQWEWRSAPTPWAIMRARHAGSG
jgi:hypothetical protein